MRREGTYADGGYPSSERLDDPQDPFDVIDEIIRLYPDTHSFHDSIIGFVRMYDKSKIIESMRIYSANAAYARILIDDGSLDLGKATKYSFAGGLLGLHSSAVLLHRGEKRAVLNAKISVEDTTADTNEAALARNAGAYLEYSDSLRFAISQLDESDRNSLVIAANRFCHDQPAYRGLFVEGIIDGINNVRTIMQMNPGGNWSP